MRIVKSVGCRCGRAAVWTAMLLVPACLAGAADTRPDLSEEPAELFQAIEAEQVAVTLIPSNARRATIQFENKTDKPLTIRMPTAAAGAPVLAQFFPPPGNNDNQNNNQNAAPQMLGFGMNQNQQGNQGFNQGGNRQGNQGWNPQQAFFNVPPGKVVKVRVDCVCLEHGKPNPRPRIPYEIRPIEKVSGEPAVRELLERLAAKKCSQRIAQIGVWHFTNDLSWSELAELKIEHLNGAKERRFSRKEVEQAKQLVAKLPSQKKKPKDDEPTRKG